MAKPTMHNTLFHSFIHELIMAKIKVVKIIMENLTTVKLKKVQLTMSK
jgi:hypothetical protein